MSSYAVAENASMGDTVGLLSTSDPNWGDTHTYQLLNSAGGKFKRDGNRVSVNFRPNYESSNKSVSTFQVYCLVLFDDSPRFAITVRSTDNLGLSKDQSLTISILDVNESPTGISVRSTARSTK